MMDPDAQYRMYLEPEPKQEEPKRLYSVGIEVKDPDLAYRITGLSVAACERIMSKAAHSEDYLFEIDFDENGIPVGVRQIDIS